MVGEAEETLLCMCGRILLQSGIHEGAKTAMPCKGFNVGPAALKEVFDPIPNSSWQDWGTNNDFNNLTGRTLQDTKRARTMFVFPTTTTPASRRRFVTVDCACRMSV